MPDQRRLTSLPAVVVGLELNGLGVVRALQSAGIASISLSGPSQHVAQFSRATRVLRSSAWNADSLCADLMEIARPYSGKLPLILTKDEAVLWASSQRERLERKFHLMLPSDEVVNVLMNKNRFHSLCREHNWPVPTTWNVFDSSSLEQAIPDIRFPAIVKPQVKNSEFRKYAPRKAVKVQSAAELKSAYDAVSEWEGEVVVQEWIGGDDTQIVFALGYWDSRGELLAIFPGRKLLQWPIECGNTALCEPAPQAWADKLCSLTSEIFKSVGYCGLGSIEFKIDLRHDRLLIMEPTVGRTNHQNEIAVLNGCNLPAIAYFSALQKPGPNPHQGLPPIKLIDAYAERRAAVDYRKLGLLPPRERALRRAGKKKYMLFRWSDPLPSLVQLYRDVRSALGAAYRLTFKASA